jgi:hypothetical protein
MKTSSDSNEGLARKATAVGVVGEMNQLFTVYEANWNCPGKSIDSSTNLFAVLRSLMVALCCVDGCAVFVDGCAA